RLARETRPEGEGIRAGDRAPDAPCHKPSGEPVRLFDLFRGPHLTLLGFGGAMRESLTEIAGHFGTAGQTYAIIQPGDEIGAMSVIDTDGHAHRAYGVSNPLQFLVRPDGYIAVVTEQASASEIRDYLTHVLPKQPA